MTCLVDAVTRRIYKLGAAIQVMQPGALLRQFLHIDTLVISEGRQCYLSVMLRSTRLHAPHPLTGNLGSDTYSA